MAHRLGVRGPTKAERAFEQLRRLGCFPMGGVAFAPKSAGGQLQVGDDIALAHAVAKGHGNAV